ncbi:hypothetical protein PQX77_020256 [Marasmius sp. AFHP31]|nr:hypothetical protein PQX77_020256 [Marasmius sp. AFHP31]
MPAVAFHYFGMLRPAGGLYGICIDCDPNGPNFQTIDAINITDDGKNPPVALFSKRFDTPARHVVLLMNQNDSRVVPTGNSQITIDSFVLEVVGDDESLATTLPSTSSTSSVSVITLSFSPSSTSVSDEKGTPIGDIIGLAIGGTLLGIMMIVTGFYCRHRRKRQLKSSAHDDVSTDGGASFPIIVPYALMYPSISKEERPKAGVSRRTTPQRIPRPTSSSGSGSMVAFFRSRRQDRRPELGTRRLEQREADGGPVPPEEERFTLPPSYEQVFRAEPSNGLSPGQESNGQSQ